MKNPKRAGCMGEGGVFPVFPQAAEKHDTRHLVVEIEVVEIEVVEIESSKSKSSRSKSSRSKSPGLKSSRSKSPGWKS